MSQTPSHQVNTAVFSAIAACAVFFLSGCDDPQKTPETPTVEVQENTAFTEPEASDASSPMKQTEPATPEAAPEVVIDPLGTVVDVIENEVEKKITVSGQISSRIQTQNLISKIQSELPDFDVVDEMKIEPRLTSMLWANRVPELIVPLLVEIENAHFRYEKGVTLLDGTSKDPNVARALSRLGVGVMESLDSKSLKNQIKVQEAK
ncbi:MAG: hypothetical protein KDN19_04030 [Verrucomicrobiae bacterium]|nr:hypothetical protein [Verrucomicrobiae bacterium]